MATAQKIELIPDQDGKRLRENIKRIEEFMRREQ